LLRYVVTTRCQQLRVLGKPVTFPGSNELFIALSAF
jgi:hypothetical protein